MCDRRHELSSCNRATNTVIVVLTNDSNCIDSSIECIDWIRLGIEYQIKHISQEIEEYRYYSPHSSRQ